MAKTCVCSGRKSFAAGLRFGQLFCWFDEAEMQNEGNGKITVFIVWQSGRKHWGAIKLHNKAGKRAKGRASQPNACQIKSHSHTYTHSHTHTHANDTQPARAAISELFRHSLKHMAKISVFLFRLCPKIEFALNYNEMFVWCQGNCFLMPIYYIFFGLKLTVAPNLIATHTHTDTDTYLPSFVFIYLICLAFDCSIMDSLDSR